MASAPLSRFEYANVWGDRVKTQALIGRVVGWGGPEGLHLQPATRGCCRSTEALGGAGGYNLALLFLVGFKSVSGVCLSACGPAGLCPPNDLVMTLQILGGNYCCSQTVLSVD